MESSEFDGVYCFCYSFGYVQYTQHFFVFWSDYEESLCKFLGLLYHTFVLRLMML